METEPTIDRSLVDALSAAVVKAWQERGDAERLVKMEAAFAGCQERLDKLVQRINHMEQMNEVYKNLSEARAREAVKLREQVAAQTTQMEAQTTQIALLRSAILNYQGVGNDERQ
jgi:uncharacterized protein YicC (UPF0701 family)